ncbi:unnamed protein product, partial [Ectocarpus fasciculatus]
SRTWTSSSTSWETSYARRRNVRVRGFLSWASCCDAFGGRPRRPPEATNTPSCFEGWSSPRASPRSSLRYLPSPPKTRRTSPQSQGTPKAKSFA